VTSRNSSSSAYGRPHASDAGHTVSVPAYNNRVATQHASTVPQDTAAAQFHRGYQQNPSSQPQSAVTTNTGVQRTPYIPSVSVFMLLIELKHDVTCELFSYEYNILS